MGLGYTFMFDYIVTSLQIILTIAIALFVYVSELGKTSRLEIDAYITPAIFNLKWLTWASVFTLIISAIGIKIAHFCFVIILLQGTALCSLAFILYTIFQIIRWRESPNFRYEKREEYLREYAQQDIAFWDSSFADINQYRNTKDFLLVFKEYVNYCMYLRKKYLSENDPEKKKHYEHDLAMVAEYYFPDLAKHARNGNFILNTPIVYREIMTIFINNFANDSNSWCDPLINNICMKTVEYLHNGFVNGSTLCYVFIDTLAKQKPITVKYLFGIKLINIIQWSYQYSIIANIFVPRIPDFWKPKIDESCISKQSFRDFQYKRAVQHDRENLDYMSYMYIQNTIYGQLEKLIENNPDLDESHYRLLRDVFCRYDYD